MPDFVFPGPEARLPDASDADRRDRGRERFVALADTAADDGLAQFIRAAVDGPTGRLLDAVFGNSPYLTSCVLREPDFLRRLLTQGPEAALAGLLAETRAAVAAETDIARAMKSLRVAKRRMALAVALADIAGAWDLTRVTAALSDFAEAALRMSCGFLLRRAHAAGDLVLPHPDEPEKGCGYFVLGMGKLGARELNYSSDIDLIVVFDPDGVDYRGSKFIGEFFVRITKDLVRMMDERTMDGYVFRTDLRLRPDPGSTKIAIALPAAETYYESFGQNWERAAMIKARCVAGDDAAGQGFLSHLRPFVWRKSLDFHAIQDIQSIKRQIHAAKGGARVAVAGHNIKLGRGGIREIEFFAQTQQLIWGGREPQNRNPRTVEALRALVATGHVRDTVAEELIAAYGYLRTLEHRLQMIEDAQTQTLPADAGKLRELAVFMGHADLPAFETALKEVLHTVEGHYADLFEEEASLSDEGNLVFTGNEDDPATIQTLGEMGYTNPSGVAGTVRGWHHGRYRAVRSTRSKEMLTELVPTLLRALGRTADPDKAFFRFDEFLSRLPAGVQLFSLFYTHPQMLDLVAEIMGDAPRLSEILARNPGLMDAVLTPGFFDALPGRAELVQELDLRLADARDFEHVLDISRRFANDHKFQVGLQTLRRTADAREAGRALAAVADVVLDRLIPHVTADLARTSGLFPGAGLAVIAMGKAGGEEMTATSDLDLICVYDAPSDVDMSDGRKPLSRTEYFGRLTQRFVNAITAMTSEGRLWEVDLRLRPSGNKGPLATSLESFVKYNRDDAWTWEHLALVRARVCCGDPLLAEKVRAAIREVLCRPRDGDRLLVDVADMRARMAKELTKDGDAWDVKHMRGGMVDVEFVSQYLQLRHAPTHPHILSPNTETALRNLAAAGLLPAADAEALDRAHFLWLTVQGVLRHCIDGRFSEDTAPPGLKDKLVKAAGCDSFEHLQQAMAARAAAASDVFRRVVDEPAAAARARLAEVQADAGGVEGDRS
ncbi:bifunctional [glutamine synthetase] adenylyltransferase/[glutamine synthetase]-adenylyl-L-tyrosine phosphorylase [Caenispirillum bisanense]|uniref:bifunctional [glutamine synthetase] adenylyltransferase/[glutamine synthetase]-adenylyl-L-tyrosine phosphorylase n=1 Tax=Caenispirillum bisanense TaxID=414052 RepID=UPI0031CE8BEF